MQYPSIPICYFPSTALFIDDNRDFLLNFVLQLDESIAYRLFDAPHQAFEYINHKQCELEILNQHCIQPQSDKTLAQKGITIDVAAIHTEVYNPNRFAEISVLVVDYAMPGMDGLELCRRLKKDIKKILLTGQADEKMAIEAFNEGLIDRYVKKSDLQATDLIMKGIRELQMEYFQAMSQTIGHLLAVNTPGCLQDKAFTRFFNTMCQEKSIVEYYLLDERGCFLLLDEDATPFFFDAEAFQKQEAELHSGKGTMQYEAILRDKMARFNLRQAKILSYNRYLEELDAEELITD